MTFLLPLYSSQKTHLIPVFFVEAHPVSLWSKVFDNEDYNSLQALLGQGHWSFSALSDDEPHLHTSASREKPWPWQSGALEDVGGYWHSQGFDWQPSMGKHSTQTILSQNYPRDFGKVRIGLYFCHIIATTDTETQKVSEDSFLDFQCGDLATKFPLWLHKSLLNACHVNSSWKSPNSRPVLMSTWNYTEENFCRRCTLPPTSGTKIPYKNMYYIFLHIL